MDVKPTGGVLPLPTTTAATPSAAQPAAETAEPAAENVQPAPADTERDTVAFSLAAQDNQPTPGSILGNTASMQQMATSKPKDSSGKLTGRLVAATVQFAVRQVMAEAGNELTALRAQSMSSDPEISRIAGQLVRKLEKVMVRARRKLNDLDREDVLKLRQARAEQNKQQRRAEEIKAELREQRRKREAKEQGYLRESAMDRLGGGKPPAPGAHRLDPAAEAQLQAEAEAMAAAEAQTGEAAAAGGDGTAAASPAEGGQAGAATGGNGAAPEGGMEIVV